MSAYFVARDLILKFKGQVFKVPYGTKVIKVKRHEVMDSYPEFDYSNNSHNRDRVFEFNARPMVYYYTVRVNGQELTFTGSQHLVRHIFDSV